MNKIEFARLYKKLNRNEITMYEALEEIELFLETVKSALQVDGRLKFYRKGSFEIKKYKPRRISNPKTRELMETAPRKDIKFKLSNSVKLDK